MHDQGSWTTNRKAGSILLDAARLVLYVCAAYPRLIASLGHTSAQVPHSVHISGSIE